jgi:hypothetical protein
VKDRQQAENTDYDGLRDKEMKIKTDKEEREIREQRRKVV